jgi:hypothetical protein
MTGGAVAAGKCGRKEDAVADINRFAGFASPQRLMRDPFLSREDKVSGLATWRGMIQRLGSGAESEDRARLIHEIDGALRRLDAAS